MLNGDIMSDTLDGAAIKTADTGIPAPTRAAWAVMFTVLAASMMDLLDATVMNAAGTPPCPDRLRAGHGPGVRPVLRHRAGRGRRPRTRLGERDDQRPGPARRGGGAGGHVHDLLQQGGRRRDTVRLGPVHLLALGGHPAAHLGAGVLRPEERTVRGRDHALSSFLPSVKVRVTW